MEQIYEELKRKLPEDIHIKIRDNVIAYFGNELVRMFHNGISEYDIYEYVSNNESFLEYLWEDIQDGYGDIIDELFHPKNNKYLPLDVHKNVKDFLIEHLNKISLI